MDVPWHDLLRCAAYVLLAVSVLVPEPYRTLIAALSNFLVALAGICK
jgi:hypothetical protein